MKNIHVLPTDKPSRLWINPITSKLVLDEEPNTLHNQNIYITSDDEIKDCWVLNTHTNEVYFLKGYYGLQPISKKIILTTDQNLIKDGVQSIDDEFLQWFVKNPSCEEVETYSLGIQNNETGESCHYKYEIIIPKEEPVDFLGRTEFDLLKQEAIEEEMQEYFKQETLEEAADLWAIDTNNVHPADSYIAKKSFIDGAKWQAERMYSEEEVIELIQFLSMNKGFNSFTSVSKETAMYFLEQFKK